MKVCTKCNIEKTLELFSNSKNIKDGKYSWCKECKAISDKAYNQRNKEKVATQKKVYASENKEKLADIKHNHYLKNKETWNKRSKLWRQANKEKAIQITKRWRTKNPNKVRELKRISESKRRARKANCDCTVTAKEVKNLVSSIDNCYYCGCTFEYTRKEVDHYVPLAKGGPHSLDNLVIACKSCNSAKRDMMPEDFLKKARHE